MIYLLIRKTLKKGKFSIDWEGIKIEIQSNIKVLEENIADSLRKAGREGDKVELIAVTKTVGIDRINEAISSGILNIGENKVQEIEKKYKLINKDVNFHMIGHLQTNKVRNIVGKTKLIHSLDRLSLAKELNKRSKNLGIKTDVLIQVNIAEEESKFGLKKAEVMQFIEDILQYDNIRIKGLMTMAPYTDDETILRSVFRGLYNLKEDIVKRNYSNLSMEYLSMGMTNDYRIAIEEGSNMIRIGSFIFGERNY